MATLNGDVITETIETQRSVKDLRARKKAIQDEIDEVKLLPDMELMPNPTKESSLARLREEKQQIVDLLNSVNLN